MSATAGAARRILGTGLEWKARLLIGATGRRWRTPAGPTPRTGGHLMLQTFSGRRPLLRTVAIAGVTIACLQGTPAEAQKRDVSFRLDWIYQARMPESWSPRTRASMTRPASTWI